jgi:two-component system sensor kinase FixL
MRTTVLQETKTISIPEKNSSIALSFLKATLNALSARIAITDAAGNILFVNKQWRQLGKGTKLRKESLKIGENFLMQCEKEASENVSSAGEIAAGLYRLLQQKTKEFSLTYQIDNKWLMLRATTFTEGEELYLVITYEDITTQTKAEQAMSALKTQNELILNSAGEGILGLNTSGEVTFINAEALKLLQYQKKEVIGKKLHTLCHSRRIDGSVYPEKDCPVYQALKQGVISRGDYEAYIRKDGSLLSISFTSTPIIENNVITGAVVTFQDTKDRLEKERALKDNEDILKVLNTELSRSNQELQDFASVASHDLQEPLRKIQALSDRLQINEAGNLKEDSIDYLNRIQNAASRMQILINDLLTFSRITTKAQPFKNINLNGIIVDILCDLEIRVAETNAEVHVAAFPEIEADPLQMRQLLQNLVANALKFRKPDVIPVISISANIVQSRDDAVKSKLLELRVQDNGIGFDEKYADKIFQVFQRLHGVKEYSGTGIGLAVCKKIVERHNGTITAKSKPGQGTTFIIRLPIRQGGEASWNQKNPS